MIHTTIQRNQRILQCIALFSRFTTIFFVVKNERIFKQLRYFSHFLLQIHTIKFISTQYQKMKCLEHVLTLVTSSQSEPLIHISIYFVWTTFFCNKLPISYQHIFCLEHVFTFATNSQSEPLALFAKMWWELFITYRFLWKILFYRQDTFMKRLFCNRSK